MEINKVASRWIEKRSSGFRFCTFSSTKEARLVYFVGGAVIVKAVSEKYYRVGLFENVNAIGIVNLTPKIIDKTWVGSLVTADGVELTISLEIVMSVVDQDYAIQRVALSVDDEEALVTGNVMTVLQVACGKCNFPNLQMSSSSLVSDVMSELNAKLKADQDAERLYCFRVHNICIKHLKATDPILGNAAVERAKAREHAKQEMEMLLQQAEIEKIRASNRESEDERKFNTEMRERSVRHEVQLKEEEQKEILAINLVGKKAEILKNDGGLLAMYPEMAVGLKHKELENDGQKLKEMENFMLKFLPHAIRGATQTGQLEMLQQIVGNNLGVNIDKLTIASEASQLLEQIDTGLGAPRVEGDTKIDIPGEIKPNLSE